MLELTGEVLELGGRKFLDLEEESSWIEREALGLGMLSG